VVDICEIFTHWYAGQDRGRWQPGADATPV